MKLFISEFLFLTFTYISRNPNSRPILNPMMCFLRLPRNIILSVSKVFGGHPRHAACFSRLRPRAREVDDDRLLPTEVYALRTRAGLEQTGSIGTVDSVCPITSHLRDPALGDCARRACGSQARTAGLARAPGGPGSLAAHSGIRPNVGLA